MPTTEISDWGDAVFLALSNALNTFLAAIPQVIGAVPDHHHRLDHRGRAGAPDTELLRRAGADRLFAEHGGEVYGPQSKRVKPSLVLGELVKWLIRIVFLVAAANVLGMTQVSELLNQILLWIPNLIVAAVILLLAPLLGRFVRGAIEVGAGEMGFTNAPLLGRLAEIAIMAFAVIVAINQIGIAATWSTPCSSEWSVLSPWPSASRSVWAVATSRPRSPRTGMRPHRRPWPGSGAPLLRRHVPAPTGPRLAAEGSARLESIRRDLPDD